MGRIILTLLCVGTVGLVAVPLFFFTGPVGTVISDAIDQFENPEGYYEEFSEVNTAAVLNRAWFPDSIPESSRQIHELYDLDMGDGWITFEFQHDDMKNWIVGLTPVAESDVDDVEFTSPRREAKWWPRDLKKNLLRKELPGQSMEIYKFDRTITYMDQHKEVVPRYLVVDWSSNIAYFWNLPQVEWVRLPASVR